MQAIKKYINAGKTQSHLLKTFLVYGFIALTMIIIKILIARLFGQEELGIFQYFFSLGSLVFLFTSFGLPEALTQTIVKEPNKLHNSLKNFTLYSLPFTLFFLLLTLTITHTTALNPHIPLFKTSFSIYIIAYSLHFLTYSILRGFKHFVHASWYSLVNRIVFIILILALFFSNAAFAYVLLAMSVGLLISAIVALPKIKQLTPPQHGSTQLKAFFLLAFSLFLMQLGFYSLRFIDSLTIKYLVDFASLGLYSAYSSITNVIRLAAYVFPVVVLPMATQNKFKLKSSLKKILLLLVPFAILVLLASYIAVPILYGSQYQATYLPVFLVLSSTLLTIYAYFNSVFVGENPYSRFYITILGIDVVLSIVVNTGLNIWMILKWGIIGAPIATGTTILAKIILNIYAVNKSRKTHQN